MPFVFQNDRLNRGPAQTIGMVNLILLEVEYLFCCETLHRRSIHVREHISGSVLRNSYNRLCYCFPNARFLQTYFCKKNVFQKSLPCDFRKPPALSIAVIKCVISSAL